MAELKQHKVDVTSIKLGMFVSALDRPWSQTSFPLQGFPLRSNREIMAIRALCQYVYIDVAKSKNLPPEVLNTKTIDSTNYRHTQVPLKLDHNRYSRKIERPSSKELESALAPIISRSVFCKAPDKPSFCAFSEPTVTPAVSTGRKSPLN